MAEVTHDMTIARTHINYGRHTYAVKLHSGDWPSDDDLITICDNYKGQWPVSTSVRHFGGNVSRSGNSATVNVYTD